jgi:hypothetical protein
LQSKQEQIPDSGKLSNENGWKPTILRGENGDGIYHQQYDVGFPGMVGTRNGMASSGVPGKTPDPTTMVTMPGESEGSWGQYQSV